jgi:hypothetical protein
MYTVSKHGGGWAVCDVDSSKTLFEDGSFVAAWMHATDVAGHMAPATIVALNDEGGAVALEFFPQVDPAPRPG